MTAPPGEMMVDSVAAPAVVPTEGRSLWRSGWIRLRRDKPAVTSGIFLILLALIAIFAPVIVALLGHPPNEPHYDLLDPNTAAPRGRFGGMSWHYLLGVEPVNGRDIFSRTVYGARVSLLVALLATATAVIIGTVLGMLAGYLGGLWDTIIARLMDLLLSVPSVLFAIAIVAVIPNKAFGLSGSGLRIAVLVFVIGIFAWPYIGRIVRGQVLSLREREFIEASRSLGAGTFTVMFRELLPNVAAPVLVYATLLIPTNILNEAALSYLGVGVRPPTASWGDSLAVASHGWYSIEPIFMLAPGLAIFATVLTFNLLGDGLRDAFDPRGGR
ncbi:MULTISPECIES: ABC transporter permease [Frankia]|uniref:ABC transporter permease n=1 Tax=Frankia TaxID=1854 RepID=UPI0005A50126|nr:ABC transporter permease [Frankia alni]